MTEKNNLKNVIIEYKKLGKLNLDKLLNNKKLFNKKEDKNQKKNDSKSKNEEKNSLTTEEYISSSQLDVETMTYVKPTPKNRNNININNNKKEEENNTNNNQNLNKKLMMKTRNYIKYQIFPNHKHNLTLNNNEAINDVFKNKIIGNQSSNKSRDIHKKKIYKKDEKKENNSFKPNHNKNNSKVKTLNYNNQNYDNKSKKNKKQLTINLNYINSINNFNSFNSSENIKFNKINRTIDNNTSKNKDNILLRRKQKIDLTNKNIFKDSVLLREGRKYRIINLNHANKGKTKGRLDLTSIPSTEKIKQIQVNKSKKNYIIKKNNSNNIKGRNNAIVNKNNNEILLEENEISDKENSNKNLSYKKYKTNTMNKGIVKGNKRENKINKIIYPCHSYYPNKIKNNLLIQDNDSNNKKEKINLITRNKKIKGKNLLSYDLNYTNFSNVNNNINKFYKKNIKELRTERASVNNKYLEKMLIDTFFGSSNNNTQISEKSRSRNKSKNHSIGKNSNTSRNKNKSKIRIINRNKSCQSNEIKIMRKSRRNDSGSGHLWKISNSILNSDKEKRNKLNKISFETDYIREFDEFNYEQNNDNFYKLDSNYKQFMLNNKKLYDNLYNFNSVKIKSKDKDININNKKNKTQGNTLRNHSLSLRRNIKNNHIFKKGPCHSAQRDYKYFNKKKLYRSKNKISIEIENSNINNNFNINLFKKASIYFKINRTTKNN